MLADSRSLAGPGPQSHIPGPGIGNCFETEVPARSPRSLARSHKQPHSCTQYHQKGLCTLQTSKTYRQVLLQQHGNACEVLMIGSVSSESHTGFVRQATLCHNEHCVRLGAYSHPHDISHAATSWKPNRFEMDGPSCRLKRPPSVLETAFAAIAIRFVHDVQLAM